MLVSLALAIVEPASAAMLAMLVIWHRELDSVTPLIRLWLSVLAAGLGVHAAQQWVLVSDYQPPRTWAWAPILTAINGLIWTVYFRDLLWRRRCRKAGGDDKMRMT